MNNILIYTFRTFPYVKDLQTITKDIVVLGKLKMDIKEVENLLSNKMYSLLLGVAISKDTSVFETKGVNKFNKGKIAIDGEDRYPLSFPENGYKGIKISNSFTTSFCNWSIYKISRIIDKHNLDIDHSFIHIRKDEIEILRDYLVSNYN